MNPPVPTPEDAEAFRDLAWWAAERERLGTDWRGILLTVLRCLGALSSCDICGAAPCINSSFCRLCRQDDAKAARMPAKYRRREMRR